MCDCNRKTAMRLALSFEPDWHVSSLMDLHDVSAWLQISPEDTRTLIVVGLLASDDGENVRIGDLVRFIDESNWLQLRAQRNLEHLRAYAADVFEGPQGQLEAS